MNDAAAPRCPMHKEKYGKNTQHPVRTHLGGILFHDIPRKEAFNHPVQLRPIYQHEKQLLSTVQLLPIIGYALYSYVRVYACYRKGSLGNCLQERWQSLGSKVNLLTTQHQYAIPVPWLVLIQ